MVHPSSQVGIVIWLRISRLRHTAVVSCAVQETVVNTKQEIYAQLLILGTNVAHQNYVRRHAKVLIR